jgi:hypothetical protein
MIGSPPNSRPQKTSRVNMGNSGEVVRFAQHRGQLVPGHERQGLSSYLLTIDVQRMVPWRDWP